MMRSEDPESTNSISDNLRYKKAIKEISRLIAINTSLKKELQAVGEKSERLTQENEHLQRKYAEVKSELISLRDPSNTKKGKEFDQDLENTDNISDFIDTKRRLEELEDILEEKNHIISELDASLQKKCKEIEELVGRCSSYEEEVAQLKVAKQSSIYDDLVKEKCFLQEKLKKSEQHMEKINGEYEKLMKKLALSETLPLARAVNRDSSLLRDPALQLEKQKVRKLKEQLRKSEELLRATQEKARERKQRIVELSQQNRMHRDSIQAMGSFIDKQQAYIQAFSKSS